MRKGSKHSEESIRKMSEALKGNPAWNKGKRHTPEAIEKMRESHKGQIPWNKGKKGLQVSWIKGKHHSPESIRKMVETRMKNGSYKHTEEQKRKISKSVKKVLSNPKLRKKFSESVKKMWKNPEIRRRISEAGKGRLPWNKGKKVPEHSEFLKNYWKTHKHPMLGRKGRMPWNKGKKGAPAWNKGMKFPEISERMRKKILKQYESGDFPKQTNTKIERKIKKELLKRGYVEGKNFIHQYRFMDKFSCDFCFPEQKLIIEADGDFWHCNPKIYLDGPIHPHQTKGIKKDKSKKAYITKVDNGSWTYLPIWESDIKKDVSKCVDKIEKVLINKSKI